MTQIMTGRTSVVTFERKQVRTRQRPTLSLCLARQWRLLRILAACRMGKSTLELAAELEVSLATITRDLRTVADAGFPIYRGEDLNGILRWRLLNRDLLTEQ